MGIKKFIKKYFAIRALSLFIITIFTFLITTLFITSQLFYEGIKNPGLYLLGSLIIISQALIIILLFIRRRDIKKEKQKGVCVCF